MLLSLSTLTISGPLFVVQLVPHGKFSRSRHSSITFLLVFIPVEYSEGGWKREFKPPMGIKTNKIIALYFNGMHSYHNVSVTKITIFNCFW